MFRKIVSCIFGICMLYAVTGAGQDVGPRTIALISDTQAPMRIEKLFLKSDHNETATARLFEQIVNVKPERLFILGDVTSWSAKEKKWHAMDEYLHTCRTAGIEVSALLGNHDVMGSVQKAESNFKKRFPDAVLTGYYQVVDSIAFVMLNSNFKKMKSKDIAVQQEWYQKTLAYLDHDTSVRIIVVSCHHAPYTNSKIVQPSALVQERFVPLFLNTNKCRLFITGHAHAFEHFNQFGKNFLVIGGGGGIHQPLRTNLRDLQADYKPEFHFLTITPRPGVLQIESYSLNKDFSGFVKKPILDLRVR